MKTIYLCGPIADRTDEQCRGWREQTKELWSGVCLDPMRRDYRGVYIDKALAKKIVDDDITDIDNSHALLVMFDKPSVGTSMEVFYAARCRKPVVIVNISGQEHISPWLVNHCVAIVSTLEEGIEALEKFA